MEILIKDNQEFDGVKNIIINDKYYLITQEHFIDYVELGKMIHIEYNKQMPLDKNVYDTVNEKLKEEIGIKHYKDRIVIEVSISNVGNIIYISISRYVGGVIAGGFIVEESSYYILDKIENILIQIEKMKKLSKDELRYLSRSLLDELRS